MKKCSISVMIVAGHEGGAIVQHNAGVALLKSLTSYYPLWDAWGRTVSLANQHGATCFFHIVLTNFNTYYYTSFTLSICLQGILAERTYLKAVGFTNQ